MFCKHFILEFILPSVGVRMEDSKQGINLNLTTANHISEQNTPRHNYEETGHASVNIHHTLMKTEVNYPVEFSGLSNEYVQGAQGSYGLANPGMLQNEKNESVQSTTTPQGFWRKRCEDKQLADLAAKNSPSKYITMCHKTIIPFSPSSSGAKEYRGSPSVGVRMEDPKQGINLNLTTANRISEQNTPKHNYEEAGHASVNIHHTLVKTEVNYPVEFSGLSNEYVQDAQGSYGLANPGMLQNEKNESVQSTTTPQGFWRKRREAKQLADLAAKNSPSKYVTMCHKTRIPFSPSTSGTKGYRASPEGRHAMVMNARNIRMQTADRGQRSSHLRSLSQCNEQNKNECSGLLRRPRRSLDSATGTSQENMCLSPQNNGFSFSDPNASCSPLYAAPLPNGVSPSVAQNVSNFEVQPKFESYQLVGDSLFVRFAEQILGIPCGTVEGSRGIGLCVSGQKSGDLFRRVSQCIYPVTERIVLLIGTNDVLQNIPQIEMCDTLGRLLVLLKMNASKIVVLTLPPIPRLQLRREHWEKIYFYNNFIRSLQDEVVSVADIHHLYVTERKGCKMEMFERYYGDGERIDLIHLNRNGLEEIHKFLLLNNFVN